MPRKSFEHGIYKPLVVLASCSALLLLLVVIYGASSNVSSINMLGNREGSVDYLNSTEPPKDKLLGGLLTTAFDEGSCLSRYQSASYWKVSDHKPSPYLLERLRAYEALHKKCGPNTELYNKSIEMLKSNQSNELMECNYVVWIAEAGLGNRIISIVSAFLYALLNNKILLLTYPPDFQDLFCEPFPETSWFLPSDFPIANILNFRRKYTPQSFGKLLKDEVLHIDMNTTKATLPFVYIHIMHDSDDMDRMFFCEGAQNLLRKMPWVLIRANNYYAPGFFLLPQYQDELDRLFPEKQTVFHHLARYLLHPTNSVWGYITRYYDTYLANAKLRLGLQIRNLPFASATLEDRLAQVINCTRKESLLPSINLDESVVPNITEHLHNLKAVLVVSLNYGYYEKIKDMYYEHSTATGELIGVYQPSHEEHQRTEKRSHNVKALAEIYLLSFSDLLVTSELSTFGYFAQGLGGLKPWIVQRPMKNNPSCRKAMSMEPCFMNPPYRDCKTGKSIDTAALVPHVRHCEDHPFGLKLFD